MNTEAINQNISSLQDSSEIGGEEDLSRRKDAIKNALIVGMPYCDAVILAGCTEKQIEQLDKDKLFQLDCNRMVKEYEKDLLSNLNDAIAIQTAKGKNHAVTWLLSHVSSYFRDGEDNSKQSGNIIINTTHVDTSDPENAVEIH